MILRQFGFMSTKVTVPVGVPEPGELAETVAVKLTVWPDTLGFASEELTVVVVACVTVKVAVPPLLAKLVAPE